jgi:hypothetical protein
VNPLIYSLRGKAVSEALKKAFRVFAGNLKIRGFGLRR